jgi:hypothetical protein
MALMYAFWYFWYGDQASGNQTPNQIKDNRIEEIQPSKIKLYAAYLLYGLWVHMRIYPIVFLPMLLFQ